MFRQGAETLAVSEINRKQGLWENNRSIEIIRIATHFFPVFISWNCHHASTQEMSVLNVVVIPVLHFLPLHYHIHFTSYLATGEWDNGNNVTWINPRRMLKGQYGKTVRPCTSLQLLCSSQQVPLLISWVFLTLARCSILCKWYT